MNRVRLNLLDGDLRAEVALVLSYLGYRCETDAEPSSVAFTVSDRPLDQVEPQIVLDSSVALGSSVVDSLDWPVDHRRFARALAAAHRKQPLLEGEVGSSASDLVGATPGIHEVRNLVQRVAATDTTVMIRGESGTGKEIVARSIHDASPRRDGPFIPLNCGAIPHELLESELFGYEKGAFTGAVARKLGRFELAQGGTLFLDEVAELPLHMQVKLLRVLSDRSFERVGGTVTQRVDVRLVAATHQDLEAAIAAGTFREDLFYRLNVFPIELPPLRERTSDIAALYAHFNNRLEGAAPQLTPDALAVLESYAWPGNVRELANLAERLAIEAGEGWIDVDDLPRKFRLNGGLEPIPEVSESNQAVRLPVNGIDLKDHLATLEQSLIRQALEDTGEVVARAADKLHIRRTTLVEKMRKYGMQRAG